MVTLSNKPKIALVHHWLVTMRGGEAALEALVELFPQADLFTLVSDQSQLSPALAKLRIQNSFLQKLPRATRWYRYYLPLFPLATERLDLSRYDLIISSDAATVKGVRPNPNAVHICYCHTPMRYVWDGFERQNAAVGFASRLGLAATRGALRRWDRKAAQRVTHFIANSRNVQRRIRECYGRGSVVIYPPVDTEQFVIPPNGPSIGNSFLTVSSLVPYKRVDIILNAFNRCGRPLVIIGDGPERRELERTASLNIRFLGFQPRSAVIEAMQRCQAFVFAAEEDFGIVMAEAQACGAPVIALGRGGALEIVADGVTGLLFERQNADSLLDALARFRPDRFDPLQIRASALRFRRDRFLHEFSAFIKEKCLAPVVPCPSTMRP